MSKEWYILHTYSGYENKIERTIRMMIDRGHIPAEIITDMTVPEETVVENTKGGKKKTSKRKFLPGYLLVEMNLPDYGWKDVCAKIKKIQGVSGFLGSTGNSKPFPISAEEAKSILQKTGEIKTDKASVSLQNFSIGDKVKITDGPFASFSGSVGEIMPDKTKLRVMVAIFGRTTPVEVEMNQVELI
ncbi:MAG: transcription termination/antitermination factor NusG [Treponema sp.]|nr:MAG: transcription termination/antitermination factor NusG [Treponema sp.]